jgi:hypothetical protein
VRTRDAKAAECVVIVGFGRVRMSAILSEAAYAGQCIQSALFGLLRFTNQQLEKPLPGLVAPGDVGDRVGFSCELLPVWGKRTHDSGPYNRECHVQQESEG